MRRPSCIWALVFFVSGCGDNEDPYSVVLTSEHFRVHLYRGVVPQSNLLDRLEADFRDARAYLKFPEAVIDYHLDPSAEIAGKHCSPGEVDTPIAACARERSIYTYSAPDHHELIHAYLFGVGPTAPPILKEGVAEGVLCGNKYVRPEALVVPPWRTTVTARSRDTPAVYETGLTLFVYLVRNFGVGRFMEYYGRARDTRDPDVFQADFESFWDISLDTTWVEMLNTRAANGRIHAICPCTQPVTLPLDGSPVDTRAFDTDKVPFPDGDPGPYLLTTGYEAKIRNCTQDMLAVDLSGAGRRLGIAAARLLPEHHYIDIAVGTSLIAQTGDFVARACAEATPIAVPPGYAGALDMLVAREAGDLTTGDWYARFTFEDAPRTVVISPTSMTPQTLRVCSSCEAAGETCLPIATNQGDVTLSVGPEMVLRATYPVNVQGVPVLDVNRPTIRRTIVTVPPP